MVSTFEFANHVVGIIITSHVDKELLKEVHKVISEKFLEHQKINLFVEIQSGVEIPFKIMFEDLMFKLNNASRFNKIAVVTDPGFFEKVMKIKDLLMDAEVKTFRHQDRLEAMNWVSE